MGKESMLIINPYYEPVEDIVDHIINQFEALLIHYQTLDVRDIEQEDIETIAPKHTNIVYIIQSHFEYAYDRNPKDISELLIYIDIESDTIEDTICEYMRHQWDIGWIDANIGNIGFNGYQYVLVDSGIIVVDELPYRDQCLSSTNYIIQDFANKIEVVT